MGGLKLTMNALRVNDAPLLWSSVTEVALAGLVKEGVSGMGSMAGHLLPGEVLTVDTITAQVAPLNAGFATLHSCHVGDLGQGSSLGSCSTAHPGGHSAASGRQGCWLSHSAAKEGGIM